MERNVVAAFLLMLRNFLQGHAVNQESLVQCQGPAIIGALLRKVRPGGTGRGETWAGSVVRMWKKKWLRLWQGVGSQSRLGACISGGTEVL